MEAFTAATLLAFVVKKLVDTAKYVTNKSWNALITQIVVFAVGIFVVVLAAHSTFSGGITMAGKTFGEINGAAQVLLGIAVGATASTGVDILKSVDNSQSSATPPLTTKAQ